VFCDVGTRGSARWGVNALVSVFASFKNFTSLGFNLGKMCSKQISSLFTITSHKSLSPMRLFCMRVNIFSRLHARLRCARISNAHEETTEK